MAKAKKQKLPKNFEDLLVKSSFAELIALFGTYDVNARGGYSAQAALAYSECPDDLALWLVEHGADLHAEDTYGRTPLHARSYHWRGGTKILLELGANPNHGEGRTGTPLHSAADSYKADNARVLLDFGARVDALNREGHTALAFALERCRPVNISDMAALADLLLTAGAKKTDSMRDQVIRIGQDFEFIRDSYNRDTVHEASACLDMLYRLFDVTPVPRRILHDGKSPIKVPPGSWQEQHQALWDVLVPASGPSATVQGEVIRTSGRLHSELYHQGAMNWDGDFRKMANSFLTYVSMGSPLSQSQLEELRKFVPRLKHFGDASPLCELAVTWVSANPTPIALPPPSYRR